VLTGSVVGILFTSCCHWNLGALSSSRKYGSWLRADISMLYSSSAHAVPTWIVLSWQCACDLRAGRAMRAPLFALATVFGRACWRLAYTAIMCSGCMSWSVSVEYGACRRVRFSSSACLCTRAMTWPPIVFWCACVLLASPPC
jgi:hypothetical protein